MTSNSAKTIGDRIRQLRTENGWTQKELGKRLYVEHGTVSAWEKGTNQIKTETLTDLAKTFGVSVSYILNGEEEGKEIVKMRTLKYIFGAFELVLEEILEIDTIECETVELTTRQIQKIMQNTGVSIDYILDGSVTNDADKKVDAFRKKCEEAEIEAEKQRLCDARDEKIRSMFAECGVELCENSKDKGWKISFVVSKIFDETGDNIKNPEILLCYNNFKLFQYMRNRFCNEETADLWQKAIDKILNFGQSEFGTAGQSEFLSLLDEVSNDAFEKHLQYMQQFSRTKAPVTLEIAKIDCYSRLLEKIKDGKIEFDPEEVLNLLNKGAKIKDDVFSTLLLRDYCERVLKF